MPLAPKDAVQSNRPCFEPESRGSSIWSPTPSPPSTSRALRAYAPRAPVPSDRRCLPPERSRTFLVPRDLGAARTPRGSRLEQAGSHRASWLAGRAAGPDRGAPGDPRLRAGLRGGAAQPACDEFGGGMADPLQLGDDAGDVV